MKLPIRSTPDRSSKRMHGTRQGRLALVGLPLLCLLLVTGSGCSLLFPGTDGNQGQDGPPELALEVNWSVNNAFPDLMPMTQYETMVLVPQWMRGGLMALDPNSGEVLWRQEELVMPRSRALIINGKIWMLGQFPDVLGFFMTSFSLEGEYLGRFNLGGVLHSYTPEAIGNYFVFGSQSINAFDTSVEPISIGEKEFDPARHFKTLIPRVDEEVPIVFSDDIIAEDGSAAIVSRTNRNVHSADGESHSIIKVDVISGEVLWEYKTKDTYFFSQQAVIAIGENKYLILAFFGMEAFEVVDGVPRHLWSRTEEEYHGKSYGLVDGDVIYIISADTSDSITAMRLDNGDRIWSIPYSSSILHKPVIYGKNLVVSVQDSVLVIDKASGEIVGKDTDLRGYAHQLNANFLHGDNFIYFTDQTPGTNGEVKSVSLRSVPRE